MCNEVPVFKFAIVEELKDCGINFIPTRAEPHATGWDVRAAMPNKQPIVLSAFQKALIPLGFRSFTPDGWWFELKPRSSTFGKKNLHCLYGTIDNAFEGCLMLSVQYIPPPNNNEDLEIQFGEAIAQIIPVKRQEMIVKEIDNDEYNNLCKQRNFNRGTGGFGSTDKTNK
jgi:dUTP pyrophosphatase